MATFDDNIKKDGLDPNEPSVTLTVNHRNITVPAGISIIEAADIFGIYIPRFCYHPKLSIAANCRMCLVEVDKVGKLLPACATPVTDGMNVFTTSKKTLEGQRVVLEFLLINHPLDCPICDQGGECDLQDLSMGFGKAFSAYGETKRSVWSEDIGPLVETEMTRCIQCTRCVRFGEEIAGLRELGVVHRGEKEEISTYVKHVMRSELSGNIIDICPVGALTNKPARYSGRGWEYREHAAIAPHDCVGGNVFLHTRWQEMTPQRRVMRAVPRQNDEINEIWMSDRDRYSHFGLYHKSRVYHPKMKKRGKWIDVSWDKALSVVVDRFQALIKEQGPDQVGAFVSPSATVEECYLLQKMMRALGVRNIDHRIRWQDFSDQQYMPTFPSLGMSIADVEKADLIFLIGSNVRFEQPLINHRINKAVNEGATVLVMNPMDYRFPYTVTEKWIVSPDRIILALIAIALALGAKQPALSSVQMDPGFVDMAKRMIPHLHAAKRPVLIIGEHGLHHPKAAYIRALSYLIAEYCNARVSLLTEGANAAGAWLMGVLPHRSMVGEIVDEPGLNAAQMWLQSLRAYFLFNVEPEFDCAYTAAAKRALNQADFVVCATPFMSVEMEKYADLLLPITPFTESGGTFVNAEGRWQSFFSVSPAELDAQPAWKMLSLLAHYFRLEDFEYRSLSDIKKAIDARVHDMSFHNFFEFPLTCVPEETPNRLIRLAPWPMVRVDHLVRRSQPLQEGLLLHDQFCHVLLNAKTAEQLSLKSGDQVTAQQGEAVIMLPLKIDNRLADNTVFLASGLDETMFFGQAESDITLSLVKEA